MVAAKDVHALTSYYIKLYKETYGSEPTVNRNIAKAQFTNILMDLSIQDVRGLLEYYFTTRSGNHHAIVWFFYNYDKLIDSKAKAQDDKERRERLMKESQERAREWRERGKQGITDN